MRIIASTTFTLRINAQLRRLLLGAYRSRTQFSSSASLKGFENGCGGQQSEFARDALPPTYSGTQPKTCDASHTPRQKQHLRLARWASSDEAQSDSPPLRPQSH